jgi:hypothetical protein
MNPDDELGPDDGSPNTGNAGKGRPKGSPNKISRVLREAILQAAEQHGNDGDGKDGLTGYCQFLAKDEPKAFAQPAKVKEIMLRHGLVPAPN